MRWTVVIDGGPRRVNHAAVGIGDNIYSFGGYCTGEDYAVKRPMDVFVFNTVSYRWTAIPVACKGEEQYSETPYQRYGHTAVQYNHNAYIFGGRNDKNGACNILYCFNPRTKLWSRPQVEGKIPGPRDGHAACIVNDRMYIFGGYEDNENQYTNEVQCLDMRNFTWSLLQVQGTPACWRDFHSACPVGNKMYIFGGRSDKSGPFHTGQEFYSNDVVVFDTETHTWDQLCTNGTAPCGRRSHSAFVYKGEMFVFGGFNGNKDTHFNDIHKLDPVTSTWFEVKVHGRAPLIRRRQGCVVINDRVYLFGGTTPTEAPVPGIPTHHVLGTYNEYLLDLADLHVLDMAPTLRMLCLMTVIENKLEPTGLPVDVRWELTAMTTNSNINRSLINLG